MVGRGSGRTGRGCGYGGPRIGWKGTGMNLMRVSPEGVLLGVALDALFGDPRWGHPVAGFGRVALWVEEKLYADSRGRGVLYVGGLVGGVLVGGVVVERVARGEVSRALVTGAVTWAVLGGTSLGREGLFMASALDREVVEAARGRLP